MYLEPGCDLYFGSPTTQNRAFSYQNKGQQWVLGIYIIYIYIVHVCGIETTCSSTHEVEHGPVPFADPQRAGFKMFQWVQVPESWSSGFQCACSQDSCLSISVRE